MKIIKIIKKIFKAIFISIALVLVLGILYISYRYNQCNRMIDAIRENDITRLTRIVKFSDPNCVNENLIKAIVNERYRFTPLGEACSAGNFEMVKLLVEDGADVNYVPFFTYSSPLACAAESDSTDNLKIVKYLIEKGADVNYYMNRYSHPAQRALMGFEYCPNSEEIFKVLMEAGADPEKKLLLETASKGKDERSIRYLVEEWGYDASDPAFLCAYCYGGGEYSYETFEYFLKHGANPYEEYFVNENTEVDCAIGYLKKEPAPEAAEKLIELAAKYGFKE